jgi:hypothetical protein
MDIINMEQTAECSIVGSNENEIEELESDEHDTRKRKLDPVYDYFEIIGKRKMKISLLHFDLYVIL